jgi:hypothetical protein
MKGVGRALFVAILLIIAGALNIIYGFGAIGNAHFFTASSSYVFANLHTWGWITVILGVIQLTGGISLWTGGAYGRVIGIVGAGLGRSRPCWPWAATTPSGRSACSRCAYGSCTG